MRFQKNTIKLYTKQIKGLQKFGDKKLYSKIDYLTKKPNIIMTGQN